METLKKLGYPQGSKLLIIHADDAGLSHSENIATIQALKMGSVNSFSIMTTCPWFEEIADFAKKNEFDYGIHLTLTCEWKHYKWGPILSPSEVPSLVNENGIFFDNKTDFKNKATADDIRKELQAQIEKAYQFGLKPTHLDSHMFALALTPKFLEIYQEIGAKYRLPILLNKRFIELGGVNPELSLSKDSFYVDNVIVGNYEIYKNAKLSSFYEHSLGDLKEGLNVILIHPAFDDKEMQDITFEHPNFGAHWRQIDFDFFTSEGCRSKILENNIKLITWKEIKNCLYPNFDKQ